LAAGPCCAEHPPPPKWTDDPGATARTIPNAPTSANGHDDVADAPYPATPTAAPPVAPPSGQGLDVPLGRYLVVDQFGYQPARPKVAVLADPKAGWNANDSYTPSADLEVRQWVDGKLVFHGKPSLWQGGQTDPQAGDRGSWFDFSPVVQPGIYYLYDKAQNLRSYPFSISVDVYKPVLRAATKMFYFNRANVAKEPPYSCDGKRCWTARADNLGPGQDRDARSIEDRDNTGTSRDLSGGWWDAGDTNKYVTFSNEAVHVLLTAYSERPVAFGDDFGIPESGNGVPDLLDEILVELNWLKKMQPADLKGGALIKVGSADYGDPLPEQNHGKRFYYPKPCSAATIVVASEFAHAALVLKSLPHFENEWKQLVTRARDAWTFYASNPRSDACDDGRIKSGDADVALDVQDQTAVTAAIYLFALTHEATFGDYVKAKVETTQPFKADTWSTYYASQGDALLYYAALPEADSETKKRIVARIMNVAKTSDVFGFRPESSLYRAYLRKEMYHWGSNNVRASLGTANYDLRQYDLVDHATQESYVVRAEGLLHSFHGVNAMQLVYLTNMYAEGGDACADEMYHAWFRDGDPKWDNARTSVLGPAPGYVTGGPNVQYCSWQNPGEYACASSPVRRQPPEKAYIDTNRGYEPSNPYAQAWELTEPGIYYQASYVRLVSKFVE
jgi:endoglucanase